MEHVVEKAFFHIDQLITDGCLPEFAKDLAFRDWVVHDACGVLLCIGFGISWQARPVQSVDLEEHKPECVLLPTDGEERHAIAVGDIQVTLAHIGPGVTEA